MKLTAENEMQTPRIRMNTRVFLILTFGYDYRLTLT